MLSLLGALLTTACASELETDQPTAEPATEAPISTAPSEFAGEVPSVVPSEPPTVVSAEFDSNEAQQLMYALLDNNSDTAEIALERVLSTRDERFISVLVELIRANQLGVVRGAGYAEHIAALEELSGQAFGSDWPAWIEWYGLSDLTPPDGFTTWKGQILARVDPNFADFLQDDYPSRIRVEEIQWGGVLVDGIPALDQATMIPGDEADYLLPEEPVFGISIDGDSRAYPLRILDWHEMANDVVGGVPLSLAYCTLCGAGIAFDGRASDGNTYDFGSSGFLYRSNKLMYDRQTRTLWNQLTGEPVLGELVATDVKLDLLPIVLTSWSEWQAQHPDSLVLDLDTGFERPYQVGAAYGGYFAAADTMFPVWQRSDELATKDRVYALQVDGIPKAYPLDVLTEAEVVNDRIGETDLVLVATRGQIVVDGQSVRDGPVRYDAGGEVRAYARGELTFEPGPDENTILDENGGSWAVTEEALLGPAGESVERINGHLAYWFGWYAFFPQTLIYSP